MRKFIKRLITPIVREIVQDELKAIAETTVKTVNGIMKDTVFIKGASADDSCQKQRIDSGS